MNDQKQIYTQADNDAIVAAVKKATGTSSRLSMVASNCPDAQGLQIHRGGSNWHYVNASIRDVDVLTAIVKALDIGWRWGHQDGVESNQATVREALGICVNDRDDTFYKS
jgi:hypothetical protein